MSRRLRAALAALGASALLAGCVSLPRTGPVTASQPDLPASEGIGLFATGPQVGAEPEAIVGGFLTASAAGYSDDFFVARQYLAGPAAQAWQPLEQVRVFADSQTPRYDRGPDGAVNLSVAGQASVDSAGRYTESATQSVIETSFTLARNAQGEWRIIDLDDGVLLSAASFSSVYVESTLHFLTPDHAAFVPEVRWFPQQNLATSLVRGLLQGPSPWLEPGVVTMVPTGTRMTVESVAVADGVARVDLSADSLSAEPDQRALFVAQLERTLRDVPGVQQVQVTAASAPYEVTEAVPELPAYPYTSTNLTVVADGSLAGVIDGEVVPTPGSDQLAGTTPRFPAVGYDGGPAVFLDGPDRLLAAPTEDAPPVELAQGKDLVAPTVDRRGWAWTAPAANDGRLVAVRANGTRTDVGAAWLAGGTVKALRISRDGARAVVVWQSGGSTVIDAAPVVRNVDGSPRSLAEPVRIGERVDDASQVVWVDERTVAVLGTSGGDAAPAVHLVPIGGPTKRLPVVEGAATITAGRGDRSIMLGTESGRVFERNGAAWRPVYTDAYYPTLPG
ncbi:LpqB family beta-propeller domain-containing protein [Georgenia ruanii]|nr:LpqB family beta-propeller domain-containing protein [Georgenia ruanii]MPV87720.1 hypothetical protein [Georgenia ruanii]